MFAEINISLFVLTIILMSITWQNVPHHFHSEAALLIGEEYQNVLAEICLQVK